MANLFPVSLPTDYPLVDTPRCQVGCMASCFFRSAAGGLAASASDTAIVEGLFDAATTDVGRTLLSAGMSMAGKNVCPTASSLDRLCEWLDLPRIAIVDVRALAQRGIAQRPTRIDALLLDRV